MKRFFQYNKGFSLITLVLSLQIVSCIDVHSDSFSQQEISQIIVDKSYKEGLSVESVVLKKESVDVLFSDKTVVMFNSAVTPIVQIGIDGYWYVNGTCSNMRLDECEGIEVAHRSTKGAGSQIQTEPFINCIVEGYRDWKFCFTDGVSKVIIKTIYCFDYDSILRGINHRGYSAMIPENTLPAFLKSRLEGFSYVETDVRFTSDGVPVCIHDASIDRTSNGKGLVKDMTLSQLKELDFGVWKGERYRGVQIPTLEEFLELCSQVGLIPYLEIKTGGLQEIGLLVALVEKYGLEEDAVYISSSSSSLINVLILNPYARVGLIVSKINASTIDVIENVQRKADDASQVFIDSSDFSLEAVSLCQSSGVPLEIWTTDSPATIMSLHPYISGVTSNNLHAGQVIKMTAN